MITDCLSAEELDILKKMKDSRAVSPLLLEAFKEGGFKYIYQTAKRDPELEICMRGNDDSIIIYYHNHILWELSLSNDRCRVSVSFNHARYCKDYHDKWEKLKKYGFDLNKSEFRLIPTYKTNKSGKQYLQGAVSSSNGKLNSYDVKNEKFATETLKVMKEIIDDFFDANKTTDYFKTDWNKDHPDNQIKINKKRKTPCIEKRWQQSLYRKMKDLHDGYYAYDLEFSQKFPNLDIRKKMEENVNEPDMLAIRYENHKPRAMVLIEVKSTWSACAGKSGIKKHLIGMNAYSKSDIFIPNRKKEAKQILEQYKELELISAETDTNIPERIDVERLLILTDNSIKEKEYTQEMKKENVYKSAIDYYKKNKSDIDDLARENDCKILMIEGKYWEDYRI
ncbi:MAG: hypothetical protein K6A90_00860 [Lachnospiraceae bacterium]|nr:hypothetical protein [Lachnospiraceae bacterium]